jgi:hypothetical protein
MRNILYGKYGLAENPLGLHVCLSLPGRKEMLGTVIGVYRDDTNGAIRLIITHFCGDCWLINPIASAVKVIG